MLKTALPILGVICFLMGFVWFGQGLNLPGFLVSFMTGAIFWTVAGTGLIIVGVVLFILGVRRPRKNA